MAEPKEVAPELKVKKKGLVPPDNESWTDEEKEAIANFRKHDLVKQWVQEKHSDEFLLRWLRARDLNVQNAAEMFAKSMKWRKDKDIDTLVERIKERKYFEPFESYWPSTTEGETIDGFPVYFERLGVVDPKSCMNVFPTEFLLDVHLYVMETLERRREKVRQEKGHSTGSVIVQDLSGLGWQHCYTPALEVVKGMSSLDADNYPESIRILYVINAPSIFTMLWAIVKPAFDKNTLKKIRIYGEKGWQDDLFSVIDKKFIPTCLGGERDEKSLMGPGGKCRIDSDELGTDAHDEIIAQREKITVKAGSFFERQIDVASKATIVAWEYKTEAYNIAFSIEYQADKDSKREVIRGPEKPADSSFDFIQDSLVTDKAGIYWIKFDNSYSYMRSKTVIYRLVVTEPEIKKKSKKSKKKKDKGLTAKKSTKRLSSKGSKSARSDKSARSESTSN